MLVLVGAKAFVFYVLWFTNKIYEIFFWISKKTAAAAAVATKEEKHNENDEKKTNYCIWDSHVVKW